MLSMIKVPPDWCFKRKYVCNLDCRYKSIQFQRHCTYYKTSSIFKVQKKSLNIQDSNHFHLIDLNFHTLYNHRNFCYVV